jgi:ApbE superfamily uncharacterized protein (UPF0280 family)
MKHEQKKSPFAYTEREYRLQLDTEGLIASEVKVGETDLHIFAVADVAQQATNSIIHYRTQIENYIASKPSFLTSLTALPSDPLAPPIVKEMLSAGTLAGVGPMAAVAGAIAGYVGQDLMAEGFSEISVENGGDVFLNRSKECVAAIFAGPSPLSNRIGIKIPKTMMPLGVCTSSGTVGHSLSLGQADSVTVLSPSIALADAAATRLGNEIKKAEDLDHALTIAKGLSGVIGVVIVMGPKLGAWGEINLVKL